MFSEEPMSFPAVARLVEWALEEDLGRGDVTTAALVPTLLQAEADMIAREPAVVAGLTVAAAVFRRIDPQTEVTLSVKDGERVDAGARLAAVRGPAASLLAAERVALNFAQRLSGIATVTRAFVDAAKDSGLRITDTRKTTPGYRLLERHAVRVGGGTNHRFDLGSGILIKDNHVAITGSVAEAIRRARRAAPHGLKLEVEIDTLAQLDEALAAGADIMLLDNFSNVDIEEAVRRARLHTPRPLLEVSGGVRLARIPELARLGVDLVSVGALTHSARAIDLALDFRSSDR